MIITKIKNILEITQTNVYIKEELKFINSYISLLGWLDLNKAFFKENKYFIPYGTSKNFFFTHSKQGKGRRFYFVVPNEIEEVLIHLNIQSFNVNLSKNQIEINTAKLITPNLNLPQINLTFGVDAKEILALITTLERIYCVSYTVDNSNKEIVISKDNIIFVKPPTIL